MYLWTDKKSKKEVTVMRTFSEYEKQPTAEEAPEIEDPDWERQIGGDQFLFRGPNWRGSKGNWLVLLGSYACLQLHSWFV